MKRIICIGNRYVNGDAGGSAVHDLLIEGTLPDDVEVVDGGVAGLNLLSFVEGAERVVFVDSVSGFAEEDSVVVLKTDEVAETAVSGYSHSAGLPYLLRILPEVCAGAFPQIHIVGIEGVPGRNTVARAAETALDLACHGDKIEFEARK